MLVNVFGNKENKEKKYIKSDVILHDKTKLSTILNGNTYSTNEQFTGKYWIDGKKIYRKAFEFISSNTLNTWIKIGDINFSKIINISSVLSVGNENYSIPLDESNGDKISVYCNKGASAIYELHTVNWFSNRNCIAIVEYTKN